MSVPIARIVLKNAFSFDSMVGLPGCETDIFKFPCAAFSMDFYKGFFFNGFLKGLVPFGTYKEVHQFLLGSNYTITYIISSTPI